MKILVIGATHLGLVYASSFANKGIRVFLSGLSSSKSIEKNVYQFSAEPFLIEQFNNGIEKSLISFISYENTDLNTYDLILVTEDTPLDDMNSPQYEALIQMLEFIELNNVSLTPIVLMSQVYPGFCRDLRFKSPLFYWVETLIFGRAVDRANNPEQVVLGLKSKHDYIPDKLDFLLKTFEVPINKMVWESAELTKISFNFMLSMSVLSSNYLATISENYGANWSDVTKALKLDSRIGKSAYLNPGLGISGGNLPRDLSVLKKLTNKMPEFYRDFISSILDFNSKQFIWLNNCIDELVMEFGLSKFDISIGLLGLTYKPGTSSTKNSPSVRLAGAFPSMNFLAYDPQVEILTDASNIELCKNFEELFDRSKLLILVTPWSQIITSLETAKAPMSEKLIIDATASLGMELLETFQGYRQRGHSSHA